MCTKLPYELLILIRWICWICDSAFCSVHFDTDEIVKKMHSIYITFQMINVFSNILRLNCFFFLTALINNDLFMDCCMDYVPSGYAWYQFRTCTWKTHIIIGARSKLMLNARSISLCFIHAWFLSSTKRIQSKEKVMCHIQWRKKFFCVTETKFIDV